MQGQAERARRGNLLLPLALLAVLGTFVEVARSRSSAFVATGNAAGTAIRARSALRQGRTIAAAAEDDYEIPKIPSVYTVQVGEELQGVITATTGFGALVDWGAEKPGVILNGFLREERTERGDSKEVVSVGQDVTVWVAGINREEEKVMMSLVKGKTMSNRPKGQPRTARPTGSVEPFKALENQDTWLTGKVSSTANFGAFVTVTPPDGGEEASGLVHISQMGAGFQSSVDLTEGQEVQVRVIGVDVGNSKLSLSMKKAGEAGATQQRAPREKVDVTPFKGVKEWMTGKVASVVSFGAFVEVTPPSGGSPVQGLVHVSQLSDGFVEDVSAIVKEGDEVKVRVIGVDTDKQKISLSMKAEGESGGGGGGRGKKEVDLSGFQGVSSSEWLEGKVVSFQNFGAFVEVTPPSGPKADGLLHNSEISENFVEDPEMVLELGQIIKVRVLAATDNRLNLSLKQPAA